MSKGTILYIGGFQLPDKNAAALRVMANAKAFRECGYKVVFLNALKENAPKVALWKKYEGFNCYEYKRESQKEYLLQCKRVISIIEECNAKMVVAYNYPAIALNKIRKYCEKKSVKCIADVTEWYVPTGSIFFRLIKGFDTEFRMRYVHPRMDGIIAISDYLYQYYKDKVNTIKVPPLVDLDEEKWKVSFEKEHEGIRLIYAGSPSTQKEKLDFIIKTIENDQFDESIKLDVIGITLDEFSEMYNYKYNGKKVTFLGRLSNQEVIKKIKEADWSIVLRENNKVVKAGFPTKVVESISCGTPVIANRFSNIMDYLDENNSIVIEKNEKLNEMLKTGLITTKVKVNKTLFDYRNYLDIIGKV